MKKSINTAKKNSSLPNWLDYFQDKGIPALFIALIVGFWEFSVHMEWVKETMLPAPSSIIMALFANIGDLKLHFLITMKETWLGFLLSIVLSVLLAILMDQFTLVKKAFYPILVISQTVPLIILAPLFALWFGFGITPKIMIVVMICFFPIVISLFEGLESADRDMINLMRSMNATSFQIFKYVKFPSGLVGFFSGLRIAATYSVMGAVIGEWTGSSKGLGSYMIRSRNAFALDRAFASVLIIVIMSWFMFKLVDYIQHLIMPWNRSK